MKTTNKQLAIVKLGGNVLTSMDAVQSVSKELQKLHELGFATILVHGGGSLIDQELHSLAIPVIKQHGLRLTDAQTIHVVQKVLDQTNANLCAQFASFGILTTPFNSTSGLLAAQKYATITADGNELNLGFVGTVSGVDQSSLNACIAGGGTALLVPMGFDSANQLFNINADDAAAAVAIACQADALLFLSDVPGVLVAAQDASSRTLLPVIHQHEWQQLLAHGTIQGGMIPKLQTAFTAAGHGVASVHIIDGTKPDGILKAITDPGSTGTLIAA